MSGRLIVTYFEFDMRTKYIFAFVCTSKELKWKFQYFFFGNKEKHYNKPHFGEDIILFQPKTGRP